MASHPVKAWVALGSNLGDRMKHIDAAIDALGRSRGIAVLRVSPLYETEPVDPAEGEPQDPYLNAVVEIETTLAPKALLERLLAIEAARGRTRGDVPNQARTLDLDLLLVDGVVVEEPGLVVPHPRLHERSFVLDPLCDLAPDLVHPVLGETVAELARKARA
jgi:2-amino-4-hydroxy-6-hydroxymethyldihydropteridine diphosphokinase